MELKEILDKYDNLESYDNETIVDFINQYYYELVNNKTENISEIEDISLLLRDLFSSLSLMGRFTELIEKRNDVKNFMEQLNGKSKLFNDYYLEVEYLYSEALTINRTNYKEAISTLKKLNRIDPENENFINNLKWARLNLRRRFYHGILILGISLALGSLILHIFYKTSILFYLKELGFGIFLLVYFIELIDFRLTNKTQPLTANHSP